MPTLFKKMPQNITGQKEINTSPVMNLVLLIDFSILKRFEAQSLIDSVLNSETNVDFNNRRNLLMSVNEAGFQIQTTLYVYILCVGFFFFKFYKRTYTKTFQKILISP